ncbi:MAG: hypothetical protein FWC80_06405 [Firmicutes bacterium]|nr:hypothetical protein [Bacillota bacterium]
MSLDQKIGGVILRPTDTRLTASAWSKPLYGKTMVEWVNNALDNKCGVVDYSQSQEIPVAVRNSINKNFAYTAVLYADTPLITKKTVVEAVQMLEKLGLNALKMTRGYIFNTQYLLTAERIFTAKTYFFDEEDFITALNSRQVALIGDIMRQRILHYHMDNGVIFDDPSTSYVDCDVKIGNNVTIEPNNILRGKTIIKDGAELCSGNVIVDSIIGEEALVNSSQIYKSTVGAKAIVGPYAYIRPDSRIGAKCRIGDFVEIKSATLGNGCKVSHMSYVGDATLGKDCNVGSGVVFVNYDGKKKHKTIVGNNVFIGSNSNIIAPIKIEDNAFVAAGSTLTENVPKEALAIARARQLNKADFNVGGKKY